MNYVSDIPEYCKINCEAKAFEVEDPLFTSTGKKIQNVNIGDGHGVTIISLWKDDVGKVKASKSYKFEIVAVKEYRGQTQLSIAPNNVILEIENLDVEEGTEDLKLHYIMLES